MKLSKEYYQKAKPLISEIYIYVEGKSNKLFYQTLYELEDKFIVNGGSCTRIRELISNNPEAFAIVDHDYELNFPDRIFPINYYSLENLSLPTMKEFQPLLSEIENYINNNSLDEVKKSKQLLKIERNSDNRVSKLEVLSSTKHHIQFHSYIDHFIVCNASFYQYKDLKKVVETYAKIYKSLQIENKSLNHLIDLSIQLVDNSVSCIFDENTLSRFTRTFN